jgi:ribosome-associated protein YbcJ (S4-like RNA binding protein)
VISRSNCRKQKEKLCHLLPLRGLILTGEGEKSFIAGADISEIENKELIRLRTKKIKLGSLIRIISRKSYIDLDSYKT